MVSSLSPGFITSWDQMTKMFLSQFASSAKQLRRVGSLFTVRQGQNKSLSAYIARFRSTDTKVKDLDPETTLKAFKVGFRDWFTLKIISRSPNMNRNGSSKVALAIAESKGIRSGQRNNGEKPRKRDNNSCRDNRNDRPPFQKRHRSAKKSHWQYPSNPNIIRYTP